MEKFLISKAQINGKNMYGVQLRNAKNLQSFNKRACGSMINVNSFDLIQLAIFLKLHI